MQDQGKPGDQIGARERVVLFTLLKFTLGMVLVPISGFFISKRLIFEGVLGYKNGAIGAAVITVILIHAIIFMYIRVAITEDQPVKKKE